MTTWTGTRTSWQQKLRDSAAALNPIGHWHWATLPSGAACVRWTHAKHEANLRGDPPPPAPSGIGGKGNMIAVISLRDFMESHITIGEHHLRARILRLPARLLLDQRDGVALPGDAAELSDRYGNYVLEALPGSVPVRYVREADGGFTLVVDIATPTSLMGTLRNDHRLTVVAADLLP